MKKTIVFLMAGLFLCGACKKEEKKDSNENEQPETPVVAPCFSVSENTKVVFSPGNLQWSAKNGGTRASVHAVAGGGMAAGTWRFAPNQWDTIGASNKSISSSYSGWIDLFGWATSGYSNKYPYMTTPDNTAYGNGTSDITATNYDWGVYNAIYNPKTNTTDEPGTWRTLSYEEWKYLTYTRVTASGIRYAKAIVNGVKGLIFLPDQWSKSTYTLTNTDDYTSNDISADNWQKMEDAGAVFLPAAGFRKETMVYYVGSVGYYWSATSVESSDEYACYMYFTSSAFNFSGPATDRYWAKSVRLVKDVK